MASSTGAGVGPNGALVVDEDPDALLDIELQRLLELEKEVASLEAEVGTGKPTPSHDGCEGPTTVKALADSEGTEEEEMDEEELRALEAEVATLEEELQRMESQQMAEAEVLTDNEIEDEDVRVAIVQRQLRQMAPSVETVRRRRSSSALEEGRARRSSSAKAETPGTGRRREGRIASSGETMPSSPVKSARAASGSSTDDVDEARATMSGEREWEQVESDDEYTDCDPAVTCGRTPEMRGRTPQQQLWFLRRVVAVENTITAQDVRTEAELTRRYWRQKAGEECLEVEECSELVLDDEHGEVIRCDVYGSSIPLVVACERRRLEEKWRKRRSSSVIEFAEFHEAEEEALQCARARSIWRYPRDPIPSIVFNIVNRLRVIGLKQEGIFRQAGHHSTAEALERLLNDHVRVDLVDDVHTLASVLKSYFRSLGEPPISRVAFFPRLQFALNHLSLRERVRYSCAITASLPSWSFATLRFMCKFLHDIGRRSRFNKMDTRNLSTIFGPLFFGELDPGSAVSPMALIRDAQVTSDLARMYIEHHRRLFQSCHRPMEVYIAQHETDSGTSTTAMPSSASAQSDMPRTDSLSMLSQMRPQRETVELSTANRANLMGSDPVSMRKPREPEPVFEFQPMLRKQRSRSRDADRGSKIVAALVDLPVEVDDHELDDDRERTHNALLDPDVTPPKKPTVRINDSDVEVLNEPHVTVTAKPLGSAEILSAKEKGHKRSVSVGATEDAAPLKAPLTPTQKARKYTAALIGRKGFGKLRASQSVGGSHIAGILARPRGSAPSEAEHPRSSSVDAVGLMKKAAASASGAEPARLRELKLGRGEIVYLYYRDEARSICHVECSSGHAGYVQCHALASLERLDLHPPKSENQLVRSPRTDLPSPRAKLR